MIERCQDFRFSLETTDSFSVAHKLVRQDLDCNFTLQLQIPRPIHLSHSAFPKEGSDFVRAELDANGQRHDFAGHYRTTKVSGRITACSEKWTASRASNLPINRFRPRATKLNLPTNSCGVEH